MSIKTREKVTGCNKAIWKFIPPLSFLKAKIFLCPLLTLAKVGGH